MILTATTTLPYQSPEKAAAGLRGQLRLLAAARDITGLGVHARRRAEPFGWTARAHLVRLNSNRRGVRTGVPVMSKPLIASFLFSALLLPLLGVTGVKVMQMQSQITSLQHRASVPGSQRPAGPAGPQGPEGPAGVDGVNGRDGQACDGGVPMRMSVVTDVSVFGNTIYPTTRSIVACP